MPILHIERPVADFDTWKREGFDSDPVGREQSGVRRYWIFRPIDDPNYVLVELEFDSVPGAEAFRAELWEVWRRVEGRFGWTESPQARIVEAIESKEY